jgi:hypothetical protein
MGDLYEDPERWIDTVQLVSTIHNDTIPLLPSSTRHTLVRPLFPHDQKQSAQTCPTTRRQLTTLLTGAWHSQHTETRLSRNYSQSCECRGADCCTFQKRAVLVRRRRSLLTIPLPRVSDIPIRRAQCSPPDTAFCAQY